MFCFSKLYEKSYTVSPHWENLPSNPISKLTGFLLGCITVNVLEKVCYLEMKLHSQMHGTCNQNNKYMQHSYIVNVQTVQTVCFQRKKSSPKGPQKPKFLLEG